MSCSPAWCSDTEPTICCNSGVPDATKPDGVGPVAAATTDLESDARTVYEAALALLLKKHADYGPGNIAGAPGGPLNGLRVRMWDKTARINHLIDQGAAPENEPLRDSFVDLLNYSAIALLVLDGKWPA